MISIRAMSSFCRCKRRTERFCNIQQLNTVRLVDIDQSSTSVYRRSRRQFNETRCAKGFGDNGTSQKPVKQGNKEKGEWLANHLQSINIVLVGDSTELNVAVASKLAPIIGYTPLHASSILEQMSKKTVEQLIKEDGEEELGLSEAMVFESLSDHIRCVISTCGGGVGAAARAACWRYIFGALTIWINVEDENKVRPQDEAYGQCDIEIKIKAENEYLVSNDSKDLPSIAKKLLPSLLDAMKTKLEENDGLCKKKGLYVRFGSRGDWPNIEPPDWSPEKSNS